MHAVAVVLEERLGHEGRRLAEAGRDVLDEVFQDLYLVGFLHQRVESDADLALTRGRDFMMVRFDDEPHLLQREAH